MAGSNLESAAIMAKLRGKALIGQSGGPTCVINQSLVGLVEACQEVPEIEAVWGAQRGVGGVLNQDFIDLGAQSREVLDAVAATPCAALRSIRKKPTREECGRMLEVFRQHDVRYFFYIGGNDSAETAQILNEVAVAERYDVRLFHVPKTIDNDLRVTDHCPGYGSAARFVACAVGGDNEDNRSLNGVKVDVIMGRHAGWLTAASVLARRDESDGPHLVYVPERDFDLAAFRDDVEGVLAKHGRCLVAVSEGIHDAAGNLIASAAGEKDAFGNVQLSGSGALGDFLSNYLKNNLSDKNMRVRADTFGYMQRAFLGWASEVDSCEARGVGQYAVSVATADETPHGSLVIERLGSSRDDYSANYGVTDLVNVARETKDLPDEYIDGANGITEAFLDYALPLVGPLPRPGRLAVSVPAGI